jgi:hypothetical protein
MIADNSEIRNISLQIFEVETTREEQRPCLAITPAFSEPATRLTGFRCGAGEANKRFQLG